MNRKVTESELRQLQITRRMNISIDKKVYPEKFLLAENEQWLKETNQFTPKKVKWTIHLQKLECRSGIAFKPYIPFIRGRRTVYAIT